jgi:hypothetical protein
MLFIKFDDVWRAAQGEQAPQRVCGGAEKLAIAYDRESGVALHVGGETAVRTWTQDYRLRADAYYARSLAANDAKGAEFALGMRDNLTVAAMPVSAKSVALINLCLASCDAVLHLVEIGRLPGQRILGERAAA